MHEKPQYNKENLSLTPDYDPDATLIAPWSKRRRESQNDTSQATLTNATQDATLTYVTPPATSTNATQDSTLTYVTPQTTSTNTTQDSTLTYVTPQTTSTDVKPSFPEPNSTFTFMEPSPLMPETATLVAGAQLQMRQRPHIGRRTLLIGGATAAIAGSALAFLLTRQAGNVPAATPTVTPVHFIPGRAILRLTGHNDVVSNIAWSPDGRYLASASETGPYIMLWEVASFLRQPSASLQTLDQPTQKWNVYPYGLSPDQLYWAPDGRSLLTTISQAPVLLDPFNNASKRRTFTDRAVKKDPSFRYPMLSPQGSMLAAIDGQLHRYYKIDLWHTNALTQPYGNLTYSDADQLVGDSPALNKIAWSCDGAQLAAITTNDEVIIWNVNSQTVQAVIELPQRVQNQKSANVININIAWSPTDPQVLATSNIDTIAIINTQQKKVVRQLITDDKGALNATPNPKDPSLTYPNVVGTTWSPDGRYLAASYTRSPKVFVWDLQAKNARTGHGLMLQSSSFPSDDTATSSLFDLSWSPNGRYLATASTDQSITIWLVA